MRTYKYSYDYHKLSKAIRLARKGRGLTQPALAAAIGRSVPTISKLENGKQFPDTGIMMCVCWLLDINPFDFLSVNPELQKTVKLWDDEGAKRGQVLTDQYEVDEQGNVTEGESVR